MNIGKDGTLYLYNRIGKLVAVSNEGVIKWEKLIGGQDFFQMSPDGKFLYFTTNKELLAFNVETISVEWSSTIAKPYYKSLSIDNKGNLYSLSGSSDKTLSSLYKLDNKGAIIWEYPVVTIDQNSDGGGISINKNGDCVIGLNDTLYSVNTKGILSWKKPVGNFFNGTLSTDANGNIYFAVSESWDSPTIEFNALDKNGNRLWNTIRSDFNNFYGLVFPLAPAYNSTFVIGYRNNKILKIK